MLKAISLEIVGKVYHFNGRLQAVCQRFAVSYCACLSVLWITGKQWSFASDSNRQPTAYKAVALTIAPAKHISPFMAIFIESPIGLCIAKSN